MYIEGNRVITMSSARNHPPNPITIGYRDRITAPPGGENAPRRCTRDGSHHSENSISMANPTMVPRSPHANEECVVPGWRSMVW